MLATLVTEASRGSPPASSGAAGASPGSVGATRTPGGPTFQVHDVAQHAEPYFVPLRLGARGYERRATAGRLLLRVQPEHSRLGDGGRQVLLCHGELVLLPQPPDLAQRRLEHLQIDAATLLRERLG